MGGTAIAVGLGSSRACKRRWAPYVRDHDPGQGQLPVSTIKAPGHRLPDARSSTRPQGNLGFREALRNGLHSQCRLFQRISSAAIRFLQGFRSRGFRGPQRRNFLFPLVQLGQRFR